MVGMCSIVFQEGDSTFQRRAQEKRLHSPELDWRERKRFRVTTPVVSFKILPVLWV